MSGFWNGRLFKEMLGFAGWNLWGNCAVVLYSQGVNILLNMFFGPVENAARGVAVQVQAAVHQFSYNFQTALNPQITKSYAVGDLDYMHNLIYKSSKFTFFLLLMLSMPVMLETDMIEMDQIESKTLSPWIYEEAMILTNIEKRAPKCTIHPDTKLFSEGGNLILEGRQQLKMSFPLHANQFIQLDYNILNRIQGNVEEWQFNLLRELALQGNRNGTPRFVPRREPLFD